MNIALALAGAYAGVLLAAFAWNALVWIARSAAGLYARKQYLTDDASILPDVVVTLVHGTWARHAAWTIASSPLPRAIREAARGDVRFEQFQWSGRNTVTSRRKAVVRLIAHLQDAQARWPHARHFVIGHSHGGNIAFQAMGEPSVAARIDGLACLSTPFLCVSPRELGPVGSIALWWFPVVVLLFCLVPLVKLAPPSLEENLGPAALLIALGAAFAIAPRVRKFAATVADVLRYPDVPSAKVLIVRTFGDEASAALGAAHVISWIAELIWSTTSRFLGGLLATVERWRAALAARWRIVAPVCVALLGWVIFAIASAASGTWLQASAVSAGMTLAMLLAILSRGGYVAAFFGALLIAFLATPFFLAIAILGAATGPELLVAALVFRVTAESTPPGGGWTVWQIPKDPMHAEQSSFLMHSATYQSTEALEILAQWLAQREGASRAAQGEAAS
jgi:hypothetical protein